MNKKIAAEIAIGILVVLCCGCSMINYSSCKKDYIQQKAMERALATGDQNIIKGVVRGDFVGLGADLLDPGLIDVLGTHPIRSIVAGVADLGAAAGAGWALTRNSTRTSSTSVSISGNNNAMNYNNGNGNSNSGTTTPGNNNGNSTPEAP